MSHSHWIRIALAVVACAWTCSWPGSPARAHDDDARLLDALARPAAGADEVARALVRAELFRRAGDLESARDAVGRAASLAPGHDGVALTRAALALERGDAAAALAALAPLLARTPTPVEAAWLASRAHLARRDTAAALDAMDVAMVDDTRDDARALRPDRLLARAELALAHGARARARDGVLEAVERGETGPALSALALDLAGEPGPRRTPPAAAGAAPPRRHGAAAVQAVLRRGPYLQRATPTGVVVRWRTDSPTSSRVQIGPAPGVVEHEILDTTRVTEHVVPVTGLVPRTPYAYAVGSTEGNLPGGSGAFRTPPPAGAPDTLRAWIVGDSGSDNAGSRAVRDAFAAWTGPRGADLWLMLGDNAYGAGTDAEYQSGCFNLYASALRQWPVWPTRGNHDVLYAGLDNDYYDHFTLPAAGEAGGVPSGTEAYYAFDWGSIHFVCLDSEGSDRSRGGAMLRWLRADLSATTQPWIVAYWHHPPYSKGSHDSDNVADSGGRMRDMRENVLPVLDSAGVDVVLTGHSHAYERSRLLAGHYGVSSTLAPSMIVQPGDGRVDGQGPYAKPSLAHGAREGIVHAVNGSAAQVSGGPLNHPAMVTSLNRMGSMVLDVAGARLDARFLDSLGIVRDSFTIVKGTAAGVPPPRPSLRLAPARPTPFRDATALEYALPAAGDASVAVYDAAGRRVAVLASGRHAAGVHRVTWRAAGAPPGLYFARLRHGAGERVVRLVRVP